MKITLEDAGPNDLITLEIPERPGLYRLLGPNAAGKTTALRALADVFGDESAVPSPERIIRRGAHEATFLFDGAVAAKIRAVAGRPVEVDRRTDQKIRGVPDWVALLNSGGKGARAHVQDDFARRRNRLAVLLDICPVEATAERVEEIFDAFGDFSGLTSPMGFKDRWADLMRQCKDSTKRFSSRPPVGLAEFRDAASCAGLLQAQEMIYEDILAHRLAAQHALAAQGKMRDAAATRAESVAQQIADELGVEVEEVVANARRWSRERSKDVEIEDARDAAAQVRAARAAGIAAEARLKEIEAAMPPDRPRVDESPVAATRSRRDDAAAAAEIARSDAEKAAAEEKNAAADREAKERGRQDARHSFRAALEGIVESEGRDTPPAADRMSDLSDRAQAWRCAEADTRGAAKLADATCHAAGEARLFATRAAQELLRAEEDLSRALDDVEKAKRAQNEYDKLLNEVRQTSCYPSGEAVDASEALVDALKMINRRAYLGASYVAAAEEAEAEEGVAEYCREIHAKWDSAAGASWRALGDIVTDAIKLPWLRVAGFDIFVLHDQNGRLADASTPRGEVREINMDDDREISTAQLAEACLTLFIESRAVDDGSMPIYVWPWPSHAPAVFAGITPRRMAEHLVPAARKAGIRLVVESPGDTERMEIVEVIP